MIHNSLNVSSMDLQNEFSRIYTSYINYLENQKSTKLISFNIPIPKVRNSQIFQGIINEEIHLKEKSLTSNRANKYVCSKDDLFPLFKFLHSDGNYDQNLLKIKNEAKYFRDVLKIKHFPEYLRSVFLGLIEFNDSEMNTPLTLEERERRFKDEVESLKIFTKEELSKRLHIEITKPPTKIVQQIIYNRSALIVRIVLERANGICERCNKNAPFKKDNGEPYLEVHHVIPLSEEKGYDTVENCIALCPNCHRHAHHGKKTFHLQ